MHMFNCLFESQNNYRYDKTRTTYFSLISMQNNKSVKEEINSLLNSNGFV